MKRGLKNICLSLLGFSATPILTACYGIEPQEFDPSFNFAEGYVVDVNLNPIENICISSSELNAPTYTDQNGYFKLQFDDFRVERTLLATDIDGAENGEFQNTHITITAGNYNNVNVVMEEK
jgi:hypothetical protein